MSGTILQPGAGRPAPPALVIAALVWVTMILLIAVFADQLRPFGITSLDLKARLLPPFGFGGTARRSLR